MNKISDKFFTGINYWASKNAIHMWRDYDRASIENDMKLLRDAGITMLRVFPTWNDFQPLSAFCAPGRIYEYGLNGNVLPDTMAGRAGVDEEMCRRFEDFCAIAKEYDMDIIVGLLTGHMSFGNLIPPALVNLDVVTDPIALRWEIRYIKYLVSRFKEISNIIAWDLGNEIENLCSGNTKDEFHIWCNILADSIRVSDSTRPIATGLGGFCIENGRANLYDLAESCDMNTVHAYNIFETARDPVNTMKPILDNIFKCRISEDIGSTPTFLQEFGAIGYTNCSLKSEAEFYRATVLATLSHGFHGTMYWCAFDQGYLTFPPYNWNNIGSDYGFYDKELNKKPIVDENIRIKPLLDIDLPKYETNCTIIVPREEQGFEKDILRSTYLLAKRANLDADFCYALDKLPDSDLYILPSVKYDKAITNTRLGELMDKVKEGASLYISLSRAYFRNIPQMAGVTVNNRIDISKDKHIVFNDCDLVVNSDVEYDITETECQVLAYDENDMPMFVKNSYGKGNIYFLFAPLEEYLANRNGTFFEDNTPDYEYIYRTISENITDKKICNIHSKFICATEHYCDDGSVYIFAINYSNKEQSAMISVPDEYNLSVVWGGELQGRSITIGACDGILIRLEKE